MTIKFDYDEAGSDLFGTIHRPIADVKIQNVESKSWKPVEMLVDSGADYTLLPYWYTMFLGIDLTQDCRREVTSGVGGEALVFLYDGELNVQLGPWERQVPVGFLDRADIIPILGRHGFLDTFSVILSNPHVYFAQEPPVFDSQ